MVVAWVTDDLRGPSPAFAAGPHSFSLKCNETAGSIFFTDATISAVLLSGA